MWSGVQLDLGVSKAAASFQSAVTNEPSFTTCVVFYVHVSENAADTVQPSVQQCSARVTLRIIPYSALSIPPRSLGPAFLHPFQLTLPT